MWVAVALLSGSLQTVRNATAQGLSRAVPPELNAWARFAFNLPFAALLVLGLGLAGGFHRPSGPFLALCAATAVFQLGANLALIHAFRRASFAQSIVFHKLEVLLSALYGALFFAEIPTPLAWIGMTCAVAGLIQMNLARAGRGLRSLRSWAPDLGGLLALACALGLVLASFALKQANLVFQGDHPGAHGGAFGAAAQVLFHTTWIEVALLSAALLRHGPAAFEPVRRHWPAMVRMGACAFGGSLGWFWAYTQTHVANVKAVGQIEGVLAVLFSLFVLRESSVRPQLPGVALVLGGIALVILG